MKNNSHKFPFKWRKSDYLKPTDLNVFTTFACGGGSTMGYKLAGYNVIAANDIDPEMKAAYLRNHNPKHFFLSNVSELLDMDLPKELYDIDVLDGSPPCSVFSMAGDREKAWGKEKHFREGQAKQILDDLFFQFLALAEKIQPKVIVAENVKGMLIGNAKWYTREVFRRLDAMGYNCQVFLLNGSYVGVPQARERIFFIAVRRDLDTSLVRLDIKEPPIPLGAVLKVAKNELGKPLTPNYEKWWNYTTPGQSFGKAHPKGSYFNSTRGSYAKVHQTITATQGSKYCHPAKPYLLSDEVLSMIGTFPLDYDFGKTPAQYLIGMSVPPVMMAQVASAIREQVFKR